MCPSAAVARNDEGQVHLSHLLALAVHVPVLLRISEMLFTTQFCAGVFSRISTGLCQCRWKAA